MKIKYTSTTNKKEKGIEVISEEVLVDDKTSQELVDLLNKVSDKFNLSILHELVAKLNLKVLHKIIDKIDLEKIRLLFDMLKNKEGNK